MIVLGPGHPIPRGKVIRCKHCESSWMTLAYQLFEQPTSISLQPGVMVHVCMECGNMMGVATDDEIKMIRGGTDVKKT